MCPLLLGFWVVEAAVAADVEAAAVDVEAAAVDVEAAAVDDDAVAGKSSNKRGKICWVWWNYFS